MCGVFDILTATFDRVLILLVGLILLAPYPISMKKLVHTTHKSFLCIIRPGVDWDAILAEAILKDIYNVKA